MSEIVHIAAPPVAVEGVIRQRCAWCGALIEEKDTANMAVAVDPTASKEVQQEETNRAVQSRWTGLVAIDGHVRWAVDEPEDGRAPERSCMRSPL